VLSILAGVVGAAAAVVALRGVVPRPAAVLVALHTATAGWLAVAAVAEALSMDMFTRQHRRLLNAFGVAFSRPPASGTTGSPSAAMPAKGCTARLKGTDDLVARAATGEPQQERKPLWQRQMAAITAR
jgi:hypothetical protein